MLEHIKKILRLCLRALYINNHLLFFSKPSSAKRLEIVSGYKFTEINSVLEIISFDASPSHKRAIELELLKGNKVYILLIDNRIVHYSCLCFGKCYVGEIKRNVEFEEGAAYIYNCFTAPEYRGKGLFSHALEFIVCSENVHVFYICCLINNMASLSVINRSNFIPRGSVRFLSIFSLGFIRVDDNISFKICK